MVKPNYSLGKLKKGKPKEKKYFTLQRKGFKSKIKFKIEESEKQESDREEAENNSSPSSELLEKKGPEKKIRNKEKQESDTEKEFIQIPPMPDYEINSKTLCSIKYVQKQGIPCMVLSLPGRCQFLVDSFAIPFHQLNRNRRHMIQDVYEEGSQLCCSIMYIFRSTLEATGKVTLFPKTVNNCIGEESIKEGTKLYTYVKNREDGKYIVITGIPKTRAVLPDEKTEIYLKQKGKRKFLETGECLWCVVTNVHRNSNVTLLTVTIDPKVVENNILQDVSFENLNPGTEVDVKIIKILDSGLHVKVEKGDIFGFIENSYLGSPSAKPSDFSVGSDLRVTVLFKNPKINYLYFTLHSMHSIPIRRFEDNELCNNARVLFTSGREVFVELPKGISISRGIIALSDDEEPEGKYSEGMELQCYIDHYNYMEQLYTCSLSDPRPKDGMQEYIKEEKDENEELYLNDFRKLMAKRKLSDSFLGIEDSKEAENFHITIGEPEIIISGGSNSERVVNLKSKNKERKNSEGSDTNSLTRSANNTEASDKKIKRERQLSESSDKSKRQKSSCVDSDQQNEGSSPRSTENKFENSENDTLSQTNINKKKIEALKKLSLEEAGGFDWDATPEDLAKIVSRSDIIEDIKEESDEEVQVKKLTSKEKKALAKEKEMKIREKEEELLEAEENPKSAEHFDRLLLSSPNSSLLWIKYMAFHLQATEIEKARAVAKRALKVIDVQKEKEKLNVWTALLNLENLYSSPDVFKDTLSEALRLNDEYKVYTNVLEIFTSSEKQVELEQITNAMVRKFREKEACWLNCMTALMKSGMVQKAREYLQRALSSLPTNQHVSILSRFALLEARSGFEEEAQAVFENILTSYPGRIDIWSVYVDMLVKAGSIDSARHVLERACAQTLPYRKMKTLFTKWLSFEETHGTEESISRVKKAALDFFNCIKKNE